MAKGGNWTPSAELKDGARSLQNKINGHDAPIKDLHERVINLEKGQDFQPTIVVFNGVLHYADVPMFVRALVQ